LVNAILSKPLDKRTPHTIVDPLQIREELKRISERGYAESVSGFEQDVHSVAAPIFAGGVTVCGALAIAAPVGRVNGALRSRMIAAVQDRARMITDIMGGAMPVSPDSA
jgi:DNA-binding IclR family transcriptional regulator